MKKILYIDLDGVAANFEKAMTDLCPDLNIKDGKDYDARSIIVHKICKENPDIFHNLEPIEGAIDAIHVLLDDPKYDVYFLSTPMWQLPESYIGKRLWVGSYFGEKAADRLILSQRKDLNIGDYLIDDTRRNGVEFFTGEHIHFGGDEYPTWKEVITYLESK